MHASLPRDAFASVAASAQLLAASPALGLVDLPGEWFGGDEGLARVWRHSRRRAAAAGTSLIGAAADAASVFDLEAVAQAKLPPWHWAWMASGATTARADAREPRRFRPHPVALAPARGRLESGYVRDALRRT